MEFIFSLPSLIKIIVVFGLILALGKTKIPFGITIFSCGLLCAVLHGMPAASALSVMLAGMTSISTLSLFIMVLLIVVFSESLRQAGELQRIVNSLGVIAKNTRAKAGALPALIGLLPMPGGAVFSAPMVESAMASVDLASEKKANINYYFRHIWEPWWPLYPGVIVFVSLSNVDFFSIFKINIVVSMAMVGIGYGYFLRNIKDSAENKNVNGGLLFFVGRVFPIALILIISFIYKPLLTLLDFGLSQNKYLGVITGTLCAILYIIIVYGLPPAKLLKAVCTPKNLDIVGMLFGVMAFKYALEYSGAVSGLKADLSTYNISILGVVLLLAFISGIVIGVMFGAIGASFPLIAPLIMDSHLSQNAALYFVAAYSACFIGMMFSPLHVCLLFSSRHFNACLKKTYKDIALLLLYLSAFMALYYWVLVRFF